MDYTCGFQLPGLVTQEKSPNLFELYFLNQEGSSSDNLEGSVFKSLAPWLLLLLIRNYYEEIMF